MADASSHVTHTDFYSLRCEAAQKPQKEGYYLLLCYEWVGTLHDRPRLPSWTIKYWNGSQWDKKRYTFDTGGYDDMHPVVWCELPPVDIRP